VFQSYALFPHLTVAQNVAFGLKMRDVPPKEADDKVAEALRLVRLEGLAALQDGRVNLTGGPNGHIDPEELRIERVTASLFPLLGVQPIVGATDAEAREKQAFHNSLVPLEGGLGILSGHLDFDCATLPLDASSVFIRSVSTRFGYEGKEAVGPDGRATALYPILAFTEDFKAGRLSSYFELNKRSR